MKLFTLLCAVGFAAASVSTNSIRWQPGQQYTFHYEGRLLTGLPELAATHFSGLGMKCEVNVNVQSEGLFAIKIQNPQYARVNDQLPQRGNKVTDNWRSVPLNQYQPIPSSSGEWLRKTTIMKLQPSGQFESLVVSRDEPEWSINFKKALTVLLQTKSADLSSGIEDNSISYEEDESYYWTTEEESLDGICKTTYQVIELPKYYERDLPNLLPLKDRCPGGKDHSKIYEITKNRDVSSCKKKVTASFYKPGYLRCTSGNCEAMWSRSSVTRYVACGTSRNDLMIQSIINEGELEQSLMGVQKAEKFLTGNKQVLTLKQVHSAPHSSAPSNPITLRSLSYEYQLIKDSQTEELVSQDDLKRNASVWKTLPRNILSVDPERIKEGSSQQILKEQVEKLVDNVMNSLFKPEIVQKQDIALMASSMGRAFTMMEKQTIEETYHHIITKYSRNHNDRESVKSIFFDSLMMAGTQNAISFIKEKIQSGEINSFQAASIFTTMAHYVMVPYESLLEELYQLITSSTIQSRPIVYNQAVMGFSLLIQKACISDDRTNTYPTNVYGPMCNPDSSIVTEKWIPYLKEQLQQHQGPNGVEQRNVIIITLGIMSHRSVIPVILPYVEKLSQGSSEQQPQAGELTRFAALYSLTNVGIKNPNLVTPVLFSILSNPAEKTQVRIASLNTLLSINPDMNAFHRIATISYQTEDVEVVKAIHSAFHTLSLQKELEIFEYKGNMDNLVRKAQLVYPLTKKPGFVLPTTYSLYTSDKLRELGISYKTQTSWISTKDSSIPSDFYTSLVNLMDRYQYPTIELGTRLMGSETLVQQIAQLLYPNKHFESRGEYAEKVKQRISSEWRQVIDTLRIKSRDAFQESSGAMYTKVFGYAPIFHSFEATTSQMLKEKLAPFISDPSISSLRNKVCGQTTVNMQKIHDISPSEFMVPSEMGFPIVTEVRMPIVASIRGQLNVQCSSSNVFPSVELNAKSVLSAQYSGWVGTILPFNKESLVTGVDQKAVINLPSDIKVNYNVNDQSLNVKVQLHQEVQSTDFTPLYYRVIPFTTQQRFMDYTPYVSENIKEIKSVKQLRTVNSQVGPFIGTIKSESAYVDYRTIGDKMHLYNYNFVNVLRYNWASTAMDSSRMPSLRKHELSLKFSTSSLTHKDIDLTFKYGVATKNKGTPIMYNTLKPAQSESTSYYPSWRKLVPLQIVSQPIGQSSGQSGRQQDIKQIMEKNQIESGVGASLKVQLTSGGQSYGTHTLKATIGSQGQKGKWDVEVSSSPSQSYGSYFQQKYCLNGFVQFPVTPMWNLEQIRSHDMTYRYEAQIGGGQSSCNEKQVKVSGNAQVTHAQKAYSRQSPESRIYEELKSKNIPLAQLSKVADKVRFQASTLDNIQFNIQQQGIQHFNLYMRYVVEYLKAKNWPYVIETTSPNGGSGNGQIIYKGASKTVDISITTQEESVVFRDLRIPSSVRTFYPVSALRQSSLLQNSNYAKYPVCKLEGPWIQTYDNQTVSQKMDGCFHLLTGDCSYQKSFSLLARNLGGNSGPESQKEIKVLIGMTSLLLTPQGGSSGQQANIKVLVNGTESHINNGETKNIKDSHQQVIATIVKSLDGVTTVQFNFCPFTRQPGVLVNFDGQKVQTQTSHTFTNNVCGLCGDMLSLQLGDLRGPQKCVFSKPEILTASYRVSLPSHQCQPLPNNIQQELQREQQECVQVRNIGTKVVKSYEKETGACTLHLNLIIERASEYCISQSPQTSCSVACKPEGEKVEKTVKYTCLPKNRYSRHLVEEIRYGKAKDLRQHSESFSVSMKLPRSCVRV